MFAKLPMNIIDVYFLLKKWLSMQEYKLNSQF